MIPSSAQALRIISALLFLWAAASTFACFILLTNQNLGNNLRRNSDLSVSSLRSRLSSDIFDSPQFGNVTAANSGLYGLTRRVTIDDTSSDEFEDEVAITRSGDAGTVAEGGGSKSSHGNDEEVDSGRSTATSRQVADSEHTGSGLSNGGDEERDFAMKAARGGEEVDELLAGVQKSLNSALTDQDNTVDNTQHGRESRPAVPLSSCDTFTAPKRKPHDPWVSTKWILPPARCKVQGFAIEELDARYNFRRGFALGFTENEEDRTHLLPYLRAAQDPSLQNRRRRVLLDFGAGKFQSSVQWFLNFYPLDFTEIHVFEERKGLFALPGESHRSSGVSRTLLNSPEDGSDASRFQGSRSRVQRNQRSLLQEYEESQDGAQEERSSGSKYHKTRQSQGAGTRSGSGSRRKRTKQRLQLDGYQGLNLEDRGLPKHLDTESRSRQAGSGPWPLPEWMLQRITVHEKAASQFDGRKEVNITRFMLEDLELTPNDAVVVKMDVEFNEWFILEDWLKDPEMPFLIDDLFVQFHYNHYSMKGFGWSAFQHKRPHVVKVLSALRTNGFYAHFWP